MKTVSLDGLNIEMEVAYSNISKLQLYIDTSGADLDVTPIDNVVSALAAGRFLEQSDGVGREAIYAMGSAEGVSVQVGTYISQSRVESWIRLQHLFSSQVFEVAVTCQIGGRSVRDVVIRVDDRLFAASAAAIRGLRMRATNTGRL